jgi:luciferase family oxidoreductase group 1
MPEVWLLGSGFDSALLAAERGLPFSFAHFFGTSADYAPSIAEHYRSHFQPSASNPEPRLNVSVQVVCAEREEEARALAASLAMARLNLATGRPGPIVSPEEALAYPYTAEERAFVDSYARVTVVGEPDVVARQLGQIADACGTTDLGVVTICFDFEARVRSYELVAEVCGLGAPAP